MDVEDIVLSPDESASEPSVDGIPQSEFVEITEHPAERGDNMELDSDTEQIITNPSEATNPENSDAPVTKQTNPKSLNEALESLEETADIPDQLPASPQADSETPVEAYDTPASPVADADVATPQSSVDETVETSEVADKTEVTESGEITEKRESTSETPEVGEDMTISNSDAEGGEKPEETADEKIVPDKKDADSGSDADAKRKSSSSNSDSSSTSSDSGSDVEEETTPSKKKKRIVSSDSEDDVTPSRKKNRLDSDDEEETAPTAGNEGDTEKKEEGAEELVADIFGDSSDEEGEFKGFEESEIKETADSSQAALPEVSSEDELDDDGRNKSEFVSDFELMMAKKKEERNKWRKRRKNIDIINDNDDLIVDLLRKMKEAADEDRNLNQNQQPALKKLLMLPSVVQQLNKSELESAFMDCGVLSALTEWLAPLPDRSLPHLKIRESLLKILQRLPHPHTDQLKSSGIGKAVMYLFKHPKELRQNRELCSKLINEWSRPIFGQSSNYKTVSREDREKRDLDSIPKERRKSSATENTDEQQNLKPGDPGWIGRARVPRPSNRDYVVRPQSSVDIETFTPRLKQPIMSQMVHGMTTPAKSTSKKTISRYEKQKRKMEMKKKALKQQQALKCSIEGRNMGL